jgi:hypothetical protein
MKDEEYEEIMRDVAVGQKIINYQTAGAKNLFLHVSARCFKQRTGCSVHLSCFVTRLVVYFLDPFLVLASTVFGCLWLGLFGVFLVLPALLLWAWTKSYFGGIRLPNGWTILLVSGGISLLGYAFCSSVAAHLYFPCLGLLIFQNYLLYAIPVAQVMKCVPQSKTAFEIFYEVSRGTLSPVLTVLDVGEYVDEKTREAARRN